MVIRASGIACGHVHMTAATTTMAEWHNMVVILQIIG